MKERGFKECLLGKLRKAYQDSALKGYLRIMIWSSPEEKLCSGEVGTP